MKNTSIPHIKSIAQLYEASGMKKPKHPLISIFQFKDAPKPDFDEKVKFTLGFYVITIKYNCTCRSLYGQTSYDYTEGIMGFTSPNQLLGVEQGYQLPEQGWCLTVHPDFLLNNDLAKKIKNYQFFYYNVNEALILSEDEEQDIDNMFRKIHQELNRPIDNFSHEILIAHLDLLLTYCNRFYTRQFNSRKPLNNQFLTRFESIMEDHFHHELEGLPTVAGIADQLNLSAKYFSEMLKQLTGLTAQQHIHEKLIGKAKEKLSTTQLPINEIAFQLGFEHSQSFSKFFKTRTDLSPLAFRNSFN